MRAITSCHCFRMETCEWSQYSVSKPCFEWNKTFLALNACLCDILSTSKASELMPIIDCSNLSLAIRRCSIKLKCFEVFFHSSFNLLKAGSESSTARHPKNIKYWKSFRAQPFKLDAPHKASPLDMPELVVCIRHKIKFLIPFLWSDYFVLIARILSCSSFGCTKCLSK